MHPVYPAFRPVEQREYSLLSPYLESARRPICDLSFANLCIWHECEAARFTFIHGNLCILIEPHNEPAYFLEPVGEGFLLETVGTCMAHTGRISRASEVLAHELPRERFRISPLRDHFDYLYRVADLAELKGKKHDGKRNQIKKFIRNYPDHSFLPLKPDHRDHALDLFDRWSERRENDDPAAVADPTHAASTMCQYHALQQAFTDFEGLRLVGGAVFVDGVMQGLIIGSQLKSDTVSAHFLYANNQMSGIYQLILQESCRTLFTEYEFINLEEDLGIPGLRKTKLSYDPLHLEKKFLITSR